MKNFNKWLKANVYEECVKNGYVSIATLSEKSKRSRYNIKLYMDRLEEDGDIVKLEDVPGKSTKWGLTSQAQKTELYIKLHNIYRYATVEAAKVKENFEMNI